jgi:hypothetical protein
VEQELLTLRENLSSTNPIFFFDENIIFTLSETGTEKNAYIRKVCIRFITMKKDNQSNNTNES